MLSPLRSLGKIVFILMASTLCRAANALPDANALPEGVEQQAKLIIAPWVSTEAPGVTVAISHHGKVVFARGAGMANLEHNRPLTPDSVFQVASVSKQFTAFATLLLVSDGTIDLGEDIRTYLPELSETSPPITIRNLLDHTGGLREVSTLTAMAGWLDDDIRTHQQVLSLISRQRGTNFAAGTEVEYSNTGYTLLAEVVARVSDMPFEAFTAKQIFEPLGMKHTRFRVDRHDLIPGRARSYYRSDDGYKNVIAVGERIGSTGLYTTALDLLRWNENFVSKRVGNTEVFALMAERASASNDAVSTFAKGQELRPYNGLETWSHGGRDAGYRSFVLRVPAEQFSLAILSNRTDFDTAKMAFALTDAFLAKASGYAQVVPASWKPASRRQLDQYAGNYEVQPGVILTISTDQGELVFGPLNSPPEARQHLPQIGPTAFQLSTSPDLSLVFEQPRHGKSGSFEYTIGLHGSIPAIRVELAAFDPDSAILTDYIGVFESDELATRYTFAVRDGVLVAEHVRRPAFSLSPYQNDIFSGQGPLSKLVFIRDGHGVVSGVRVSGPLAEEVMFSRVVR